MQRSWQTADEGCRFTSIKRKKPNCDNSLNVSGFRSLKGKTGHKNNGGITMITSIKKPKHSYKQPTEEDKRRHAAVLQKVQLRRSSTAEAARNDQSSKRQGMEVILNRVRAKRGSGEHIIWHVRRSGVLLPHRTKNDEWNGDSTCCRKI
jgi:hypothetical protein